jgi:hypothetical protein
MPGQGLITSTVYVAPPPAETTSAEPSVGSSAGVVLLHVGRIWALIESTAMGLALWLTIAQI